MDYNLWTQISNLRHEKRTSKQVDSIDSNPISFKGIVIGDIAVGKTCLIHRLLSDSFNSEHFATVGVDYFCSHGLVINGTWGVKLNLWDSAGQEKFRSITRLFYKDTQVVFLVFNLTDRSSFDNLHSWIHDVNSNTRDETIKYLVGNQSDREQERRVSREEALKFMRDNFMNHYVETSALVGTNVNELFNTAAKHLYLETVGTSKAEEAEFFDQVKYKSTHGTGSFSITTSK